MTKFLQLMHFVRPPYVFFSSTRSELLAYMDCLKTYEQDKWQIVGGFTHIIELDNNQTACKTILDGLYEWLKENAPAFSVILIETTSVIKFGVVFWCVI